MRLLRTSLACLGLLLTAASAWAVCPNANGVFSTYNGGMIPGRASEAWCGAGGAPTQPGVPGNTENAMSWDGANLGGQWKVWGMQIDPNGAILVGSRSFGPYTYVDYVTDYTGGQFWLSRNGAWGDGYNDVTGVLTAYHVATTITLYNGNPVGQTSNITFTGAFTDCPEMQDCTLEFVIANAMKVWDSGYGTPMPANFPPLLCDANLGELFDVCCIQMSINCAVPAEEHSWGSLKAMYR